MYKVYLDDSEHEIAPADYIGHWYQGQHNAQPVYLEIEAGENPIIDYDSEIGGAVPEAVWNNRILRIQLPSRIYSDAEAEEILEDFKEEISALEDSYNERWTGQNHMGSWDYDLEDKLREKLSKRTSLLWWDSEGIMD